MDAISRNWTVHAQTGPIEILDSPTPASKQSSVPPKKRPAAATAGIPLLSSSGQLLGDEPSSSKPMSSMLRRARAYDEEDGALGVFLVLLGQYSNRGLHKKSELS